MAELNVSKEDVLTMLDVVRLSIANSAQILTVQFDVEHECAEEPLEDGLPGIRREPTGVKNMRLTVRWV